MLPEDMQWNIWCVLQQEEEEVGMHNKHGYICVLSESAFKFKFTYGSFYFKCIYFCCKTGEGEVCYYLIWYCQ